MRLKPKIIIVIIFVVVLLGTLVQAAQKAPPYPTKYWLIGKIEKPALAPSNFDLENYGVVFYSKTNSPEAGYAKVMTDSNGKFVINAMDDLRVLLLNNTSDFYMGVGKKTVGTTSYGMNQKKFKFTVTELLNGCKVDFKYTLVEKEGIKVPGAGPKLTIKVLLQGLVNLTGSTYSQKNATVVVEARAVTTAISPTVQDATILVASSDVQLVNGVGTTKKWVPALQDGNYFFVIKQKHPGIPPGMSHIPIITDSKIPVVSGTPITLDFTKGVGIYTDKAKFPAMATMGLFKTMWAGDMNGDTYVNATDVGSAWWYLFTQFDKKVSEKDLNKQYSSYNIADLNGDGQVNALDVGSPWYAGFLGLNKYNGPHTYVPKIKSIGIK